MSWLAKLDVDYSVEDQRCVARHVHEGPLRILKSLYPEGDAVCHNILVHPPSGLVPRVVVLRVLSDQLEPAVDLLKKVWLQWRSQLWGMPAVAPRIWAM
jgi:urease accessory protein UreH